MRVPHVRLTVPALGIATALSAVVLGLGVLWWESRDNCFGKVAEPIAMVWCISMDDGGSKVLTFQDSRQVRRTVCLLNEFWEGGRRNLVLNSESPPQRRRLPKVMPIGGVEEKTLLGLLERWCRQDPDAKMWDKVYERYEGGEIELASSALSDPPADQVCKSFAVGLLRDLRVRN